jgi:predicted permease
MAVRRALGAARGTLIRQLLVESALVASLGGACGAIAAAWGFHALTIAAERVPRLAGAHFDGAVFGFALAVSVAAALLFGLMPALQLSCVNAFESLKQGGPRFSDSRRVQRARSVLVASDVALATVLLVAAALLIQSLWRLQHLDPGFVADHVLSFKIDLPYTRYDAAAQPRFFQRALERIGRVPGVRSISAALPLPLDLDDGASTSFEIEGRPAAAADRPNVRYNWVEPGFFGTLRVRLVQGRDFTFRDDLSATPVVIVNQAFATHFFPKGHAIGARIKTNIGNGYDTPPMRQIVGIVGDVRLRRLTQPADPQVYVPLAQSSAVRRSNSW